MGKGMSGDALPQLRQWIAGLSPETIKNLKATLAAVIPIAEVRIANPLDFFPIPRSDFGFDAQDVSEKTATELLEAIKWKSDSASINVESERLILTARAVDTLKYAQRLISEGKGQVGTPNWIPENLRWEDITIEFKDGHDVVVRIGKLSQHVNYKEMGFQNQKTRKPDSQWAFFRGLAVSGGAISWKNSTANVRYKKTKQLLSERLKTYFNIQEDPFYPYRKEGAYRIKITLIPEQGASTHRSPDVSDGDEDDDLR